MGLPHPTDTPRLHARPPGGRRRGSECTTGLGSRSSCPSLAGDSALSDDRARRAMSCWECETATTDLVTVILRTPSAIVGELSLCPRCYATCYQPLARQAADPDTPVHSLLVVATDAAADCPR